jgi:hypothetical protein
MHIAELLAEAIGTVGTSTDPLKQDGLPKTSTPAGQIPLVAPGQTPPPAQQIGQTPPAPALGTQAAGQQPPAPNPALQQGMKTTMTDLDKIAAQIVGLKQKQQQMQQQMQQPLK